jgi:hypothetical protein
MITKKTVLILGAGASIPYGYPSGNGLCEIACKELTLSGLNNLLDLANFQPSLIESFRDALLMSGKGSIDEFLEHQKRFIDLGKNVIAALLIPYEITSSLYSFNQTNWYRYLFQKMNTGFDEFEKNNISFITFNYDRSLEHFLLTSLKNSYPITELDAALKIRKLKIIHLHGQLCKLPYIDDQPLNENSNLQLKRLGYYVRQSDNEVFRPYSKEVNLNVMATAAKYIKIIHDSENKSEYEEAMKLISEAQRVYFLGFGYHPTNLERLGINGKKSGRIIGGTAMGLSPLEMKQIHEITGGAINQDSLIDTDIVSFFRNHFELD